MTGSRDTSLLEVEALRVGYPDQNGRRVQAVRGVDLALREGEVLGIVGESGCGKTTLARAIMRLMPIESGRILLQGRDFGAMSGSALKEARRDIQMIFQDPFGSLNPRHRVGAIIAEPMIVHGVAGAEARLGELLDLVGLPRGCAERYPHEFSGGQRQRIAIARALALRPKIIIADEPVSALDVSIQSQIINLIAELKHKLGLAMIFISHDLSVIRHVSDRIAVMHAGTFVETGTAADIFARPAHDYTRGLIAAIPRIATRHAAQA